MKKLFIFSIALSGLIVSSLPSFGQCVADTANLSPGQLIYPAQLPCILRDSVYSGVLSILVPDSVPGADFNNPYARAAGYVIVDSINIQSITGEPTGITSSSSPALGTWIPVRGYACAAFTGTAPPGTALGNYPLTITGIGCGHVTVLGNVYDTCMPFNFSTIYPYDLQVCDTLCTNARDTFRTSLCRGDSIQWGSSNIKRAGTYIDTALQSTGCDSIKILIVTTLTAPVGRDTLPVGCGSVTYNAIAYTHDTTISVVIHGGAANGCDSTSRHTIIVGGTVIPTISLSGGIALTATDPAATSWQWLENGSPISGATGQNYQPTGSTQNSYSVVAQDAYGCFDTSAVYLASGINNLSTQNVKLYPNPNNGSFILETHSLGVEYTITNSLGQVVEKNTISSMKQEINLVNAKTGVYTISMKGIEPIQFTVTK